MATTNDNHKWLVVFTNGQVEVVDGYTVADAEGNTLWDMEIRSITRMD